MKLVVLAAQKVDVDDRGAVVLRLVGFRSGTEVAPTKLMNAVLSANARVRDQFPRWLWGWISRSGALTLAEWPGPISWWWYTPLSEMSPHRSQIIKELYWLALLAEVLRVGTFDHVHWCGDDRDLANAARQVADRQGVRFTMSLSRSVERQFRFFRGIAGRASRFFRDISLWVVLRLGGFQSVDGIANASVLLFSRFPVLWYEAAAERWRERMYGSWPEFLEQRGFKPAYVATYSASPMFLIKNLRATRTRCHTLGVALLEAYGSLASLIAAHADMVWWFKYWRWRRTVTVPFFDGIDVRALALRELDHNVLDVELVADRVIASALRKFVGLLSDAVCICLPFEYQPLERAVWAGVSERRLPVIGLQTGLFTSNQMGFIFPAEQVRRIYGDPHKSPLPDLIAAYGDIAYDAFVNRLGPQRVCLSGGVRYAPSTGLKNEGRQLLRAVGVPDTAPIMLVTVPFDRDEALMTIQSALSVAARNSSIWVLVKFHYHQPLQTETAVQAEHLHLSSRVRIVDAALSSLLSVATGLVTGGGSTSIEGVAAGCMPLVYLPTSSVSASPALEVPDAVFFWKNEEELQTAWQSVLARDEEYTNRQRAWPNAIAGHFHRIDDLANERLFTPFDNLVGSRRSACSQQVI